MSKRKTIKVEELLERYNTILASQAPQEAKIGIATAAEILLMDTNRYAGFRYLDQFYNAATERYDHYPDTEYSREYFIKSV
jgi:hypothetical protein